MNKVQEIAKHLSMFNNKKKEACGKGLILIGYLLFVLHYLGY